MLIRGTHIVLTALLISVMALVSGSPATAHDPSFGITSDAFYAHSLATDGEYIAWRWGNTTPSSRAWGLYVARVSDASQVFYTVVGGGTHAVGDDKVVWERQFHGVNDNNQTIADPGIYGQDLLTGEPFVVTLDTTQGVAMHDSVVVWIACPPGSSVGCEIRMRDLAGGETTMIAAMQRRDFGSLRYNGDVVTWQETDSFYDGPAYLMGARPGEEPVQLLTDNRSGRIWWYGLLNDLLAWVDSDHHLNGRDLNTGATRVLTDVFSYPITTDGRYLVWRVDSNETDATPPTVELRAWDSLTDSQFTIVTYPPTTGDPPFPVYLTDAAFADGVLTWRYFSDDDRGKQIRAAYLSDVLPTGREPDPEATNPAWTYYPESGHYLSQGFRDYWEENGGLPVFGYPLTEEYYEQDFPAQFTERQRFEWHAENAGTHYDVLLGRLGAELLAAQGRDWLTFPTADPSSANYFPETRHAIAPEFWDYWSGYGLDLGAPDISVRESLALFGYPLSEPMLETNADGDTVLTQYFERAVFEHHPDNPVEWQVLLRRLGAETIRARGW